MEVHRKPKPEVMVVTGTSAGVGRALARECVSHGVSVVFLARSTTDGLDGAKQDVEHLGGRGLAIPTDVSHRIEAADEAEQEFGPIDVWVNNTLVSVLSPRRRERRIEHSVVIIATLTLFSASYQTDAAGSSAFGEGRLVLAQTQLSGPRPEERVVSMTEREKAVFDQFVNNEARFRDHYQSHYADSGYDYNQYRPAYQHGFGLALDPRYQKMEWNSLEPQARGSWNEATMGLWDRYKDAVRFGWEQGVLLERS